jgi:hypothetical protein
MAEPRVKVSIALRRDQVEALRLLADAERHGNVSFVVQRAIDRELDTDTAQDVLRAHIAALTVKAQELAEESAA